MSIVILIGLVFEVTRIVNGSADKVTASTGGPTQSSIEGAPSAASSRSPTNRLGPLSPASTEPITGGLTGVAPTKSASPAVSPGSPDSSLSAAPDGVSAAVVEVAASQLRALAALRDVGVPGAPVVAALMGEKVRTGPGVVIGRWESSRLPNGMTAAANNDRALRAGDVVTYAKFPTATGTSRLKLRSGQRISVPIQSARSTLHELRSTGGPDCPACKDIVLTSVKSTTMPVQTHLGPLTVPAWRFTVRDSKVVLVHPAVAPAGLLRFTPSYRGSLAGAVKNSQLPLWRVALGKDNRTVTANLESKDVAKRGGCWRLVAQESSLGVALYAAKGKADSGGGCADRSGRVTVRLAEPLGSRVAVDTYWRRALALG
ncbi:MAG: hypothetical protein Q4P32_02835 [Micrococcales bacterium]|nr:hypothetical protein [Micrococcales bacterium]